ncbi:MAG: hypothetical protein HYY67_02030 [Thaumarchaeota archaeon]|nr:hypothetical protein [Nitrososphaerota archaeon]
MSSGAEIIIPLDKKGQFQKTPLYIAISPTDVATVWKFPNSHAYFVAGKYLGLAKDGENVKGQRYRKLTEHEKNIVSDAVKLQDKEAVLKFELE